MRLIRTVPLAAAATFLAVSFAAAEPCSAPQSVWGGFAPLPETAHAVAVDHHLTVVALGSSSTEGTGASSPEHSYPAELAQILRARLPGVTVEVLNKGIRGETIARNLDRLDRDVLAFQPDLVIWQAGTNDAFKGVDPGLAAGQLRGGIQRIRSDGSDVVLMDTQLFPARPDDAAMAGMRAMVDGVAHELAVPELPRMALMRYWLQSGQFTAAALVGPDQTHMTDASYRCLAERVADIFPTAVAPLLTAAKPTPTPAARTSAIQPAAAPADGAARLIR